MNSSESSSVRRLNDFLFKGSRSISEAYLVGVPSALYTPPLSFESVYVEKIAPVKAVNGNCDHHPELNDFEVIKIENIKLGLTHGTVYPKGDTQQLYYLAKQLGVHILISGHTHRSLIKQVNDVLLLNPGSPTQPRSTDATIMLLKIENSNVEAEIIKI